VWCLWLLLTGGIPPIGFRVPVLIDRQLAEAAVPVEQLKAPAALRQPLPQVAYACDSSQLAGSSRGSLVVAGTTVDDARHQLVPPGATPAVANPTADVDSGGGDLAVERAASMILYVQCGSDGVLQLTFEQLLQLSGGSVADVAEAAEDGVLPVSAAAAAAHISVGLSGPDPHLSGGQQLVVRTKGSKTAPPPWVCTLYRESQWGQMADQLCARGAAVCLFAGCAC
jgi:hypothetical protein